MIGIIILNFNSERVTTFCLTSLRSVKAPDYTIYLVDNASSDSSFENLIDHFPEVTPIYSDKNLGFSGGCNIGINRAFDEGCEDILLLNNDIEVTPTFLLKLKREFDVEDRIAAATSKIFYRNDKKMLWQAGGHIDLSTMTGYARGLKEIDTGQFEDRQYTGWASGACSLIRGAWLREYGLLDEAFFFGQEEWDLSVRILRSDWAIVYQPESVVYHEAGGSTNPRPSLSIYQNYRNKLTMARKHLGRGAHMYYYLKLSYYIHILFPRKGMFEGRSAYFKAAAKPAAKLALRDHISRVPITEQYLISIEERLQNKYQTRA